MNQKISRNSRLITIFPQNFWVKPRIGLAWMADYYIEMKQKEKSAYVDFRTDVETSRYRHIQLVEKDERLISFNYQNLQGKLPIFPQNFWFKLSTGLAWMPDYNDMTKTQTRMGGEPTADESPNLVDFMYTADQCLNFFTNGLECGIIVEGHPSKKEEAY